jgi:hypothetical protein
MKELTAAAVLEAISRGETVHNAIVAETIELRLLAKHWPLGTQGPPGTQDQLLVPVSFVGCQLHCIDAVCLHFHHPFVLRDTVIDIPSASFYACYFLEGYTIERSTFCGDVDFQCGGHNATDKPVIIRDSTFRGFVNFLDCWFMGPVEVRNCCFEKGTNLLGNKGQPFEVTFDVAPLIDGNSGDLDLNGG